MKIAVTSTGNELISDMDPRFGRAKYFIIVDTETLEYEVAENRQNLNLPQGAGIQAAQNVVQHRPDVVLTGNCGPKAFQVLKAGGIKVVVGVNGTIMEAIQAYIDGKYKPADDANVEGHWM